MQGQSLRVRQIKPVSFPTPAAGSLNVQAIRLSSGKLGSTQRLFARAIGASVKTLQNWEQRRREPTGSARVLLALIARDPRIIDQHMHRPTA